MRAITARHLRKTYGDRTVLDDLDLDVHVGEIFALLGPNGAGKSTTVEILEGHRLADSGMVDVLGVDPATGDGDFRRRLGIVPQETSAFARSTVSETLSMFASLFDEPMDVAEALDVVGLEVQRTQLVDTLSGGQRRRLDVACGLVGRPDLVFLDEPTTGLDPEARRAMWATIDSVRERGATVLMTTHLLDEAERLADRIGVILGGRIATVADPATLGDRHRAGATVSYRSTLGDIVSISTLTPGAVVADLVDEFAGEPPELSVATPSLEDTYLDMVRSHQRTGLDLEESP